MYSVHRKGSIVYRVPDFVCCLMNWGHLPPPPQASVGEQYCSYVQEVERQRGGGSHFARERGSQIIRQYSNYGTFYTMLTLQCTFILSLPNILETHTFCCRLHGFAPVIPSTYI
jgi:hypothetical protein